MHRNKKLRIARNRTPSDELYLNITESTCPRTEHVPSIGVISKLDYFVELGVETLWIGPLLKSPMVDMGYDVDNFTLVDPLFGTMDDFDELISEMNKRSKTRLLIETIKRNPTILITFIS